MNQTKDFLTEMDEDNKLPTGINVLTILTFIGSALAILGSVYSFSSSGETYKQLKEGKFDNLPPAMKSFMPSKELIMNSYENRLPILILGLASVALCIYGAIEMRKLKKQGFTIYAIGEIVIPLIITAFFLGFSNNTMMMNIISYGIPGLFLILYGLQTKHMR
jgi:hypothetical protein